MYVTDHICIHCFQINTKLNTLLISKELLKPLKCNLHNNNPNQVITSEFLIFHTSHDTEYLILFVSYALFNIQINNRDMRRLAEYVDGTNTKQTHNSFREEPRAGWPAPIHFIFMTLMESVKISLVPILFIFQDDNAEGKCYGNIPHLMLIWSFVS